MLKYIVIIIICVFGHFVEAQNLRAQEDKTNKIFVCIEDRNEKAALDQLKYVDVNIKNVEGYTPLILSVKKEMYNLVDSILNRGANVNLKDDSGYTALNYAKHLHNRELIFKLLMNGAKADYNKDYSYNSGLHIHYVDNRKYAFYLKHDGNSKQTYMEGSFLKDNSIKDWLGENSEIRIIEQGIPECNIQTAEPVFAIGDIHGKYDRLVKCLRDNGIINEENKWIFGKGHLVSVGDIFDRGDKVTESFWLLYKLEQEAKEAGGAVHLLLGNHELMIFENDLRYINEKYARLSKVTGLEYSYWFKNNSVLGDWLRSKNSIIRINDVLYVHGGISDKLVNTDMKIKDINDLVRIYLNGGYVPNNKKQCKLVLGSKGCFWYRGYFQSSKKYKKISSSGLSKIMKKLQVNTIVVGHTENDKISSYYDEKIIDINIPLKNMKIPTQGLLIKDNHFYRCYNVDKVEMIK